MLKNFLRLLEIHIQSKTTGTQFHQDTEKAYELAFDCHHLSSEMEQDLWVEPTTDEDRNWQETYDLLEWLKDELQKRIDGNEDIWYDNRLRGLYERVTDMCGTFRQYVKEEEEETETEETTPKKQLFNIK